VHRGYKGGRIEIRARIKSKCEQFRDDSAVGAGDKQGFRGLGGGEIFKKVCSLREYFFLKLYEFFYKCFQGQVRAVACQG